MDRNHNHSHQLTKNIKIAFFLNFSFAILEIFGGIWTNSLAIISDAIHDLGDSFSLAMAWYLESKSHKKSNSIFSYGYRRLSLLAALINTVVLLAGSVYIIYEAIPRLIEPQVSDAKGMILFAILGIAVNGIAMFKLLSKNSFNASVVGWHLLEDILGWVAVLIVSIVLMFTDFYILDPILSIFISAFILYNAIATLRKTLTLFLQGVPNTINLKKIEANIVALDRVDSIHHTHIWSLDGEHHVFSTHVVVINETTREEIQSIKNAIQHLGQAFPALQRRGLRLTAFRGHSLNLEHITVEIEYQNERCIMG